RRGKSGGFVSCEGECATYHRAARPSSKRNVCRTVSSIFKSRKPDCAVGQLTLQRVRRTRPCSCARYHPAAASSTSTSQARTESRKEKFGKEVTSDESCTCLRFEV